MNNLRKSTLPVPVGELVRVFEEIGEGKRKMSGGNPTYLRVQIGPYIDPAYARELRARHAERKRRRRELNVNRPNDSGN